MVSAIFTDFINNLQTMGVLDAVLPFLLFFTILFATLQKTKVLGVDEDGEPQKNFNVIVALVIALMIVIPHVYWNNESTNTRFSNGWPDPVVVVNSSLPQISVIAVGIVMVMMLVGLVGGETALKKEYTFWAAIISGIIVVAIFLMSAFGEIPQYLRDFFDSGTMSVLLIILVFGLIIYFITKSPKKQEPTT